MKRGHGKVETPPPPPPKVSRQKKPTPAKRAPPIASKPKKPPKFPDVDSENEASVNASTSKRSKKSSQLTFGKAMEQFPKETHGAVVAELKQMLELKVWRPVNTGNLSPSQFKSIIPSSLFCKQKFLPNGQPDKFKARLVAGGHRQIRNLYDEAKHLSSPTVKSQSVLMVAAIAATEKRDVATLDVKGAYLNASLTRVKVFMRIEPRLAKILVQLDKTYKQFLSAKGDLVVELEKALYGCVESARAWYDLLSKYLLSIGFEANRHDLCVFNKLSDAGLQTTLTVHVDDLFVTSKNRKELAKVLNQISTRFPGCTIHEKGPYSYVGMTFDFDSSPSQVCVSQMKLVNEVLSEAGRVADRSTPAGESLFAIPEGALPLAQKEKEIFHSRIAKLLYLAKHTRPDLLTGVSFLTTRVREPTEADAAKLSRLIGYLQSTQHTPLRLNARAMRPVVYVDASFAVHPKMLSHTGIVIAIGDGAVFAKSSKQKLVTKSSTEAELVGISDALGYAIWTRNWMIAQGHKDQPAILFQDNQSTIVLAHKGQTSAERTRHINIRYFFIKDRIENGEVVVKYLSTDEMIADGLSKPLQGNKFKKSKRDLMNEKR
jgi:hypothetical protein